MKAARLVVLGVAVAAGGIAAYLAAGSKSRRRRRRAAAAAADRDRRSAGRQIRSQPRQVIESPDIGWQIWPAAAANATYIKKTDRPDAINNFVGAIVRVAMVAGDPIRDPNVVMAKGSGFMAAVLPQGMRAVAVEISPEAGAGGFILPDDRVDVVLTHHDKAAEKTNGVEKFVSDTILRNIRVLAVDQNIDEKNGAKSSSARRRRLN